MAFDPRFVKRKFVARGAAAALLLGVFLAAQPTAGQTASQAGFELDAYARVLEAYVTPEGQVRYAELKQNPADLDAFLKQLAAVSPETQPDLFPGPAAQMAYWINAYNAFVLKGVVDSYPIHSVVSLRTAFGALFFKRARWVAGGRKLSLDDIEHGILRRQFSDPRVHFAVNCASASCPVLRREPYRADTLDAQLDDAARNFISRQENVWMRGDVLFLSKIFDWYGEDFVKAVAARDEAKPTVVDYLARYLPAETAARVQQENPRIEFYNYDWSLNDASSRGD